MRLKWLAPPRIAITSGDSREYRSTAFVNGAQFFYGHSAPFLRPGLNGIKKSLGRRVFALEASTRSSHGI